MKKDEKNLAKRRQEKLELASKMLSQKNEYLKLPKVAKILSEICESELPKGNYIRKRYISLDKRIPIEVERVEEWVESGDIRFITKHIDLSRLKEAIDYFYSERTSDNIRIAAEYLLNATYLSLDNIFEEIRQEVMELS